MKCTFEVVALVVGFTPVPGTVYDVPRAQYRAAVAQYSYFDIYKARRCANKLRIKWRFVD